MVLPTYGSPYLADTPLEFNIRETLQGLVGGEIHSIKPFTIHPMYLNDERWRIAQHLLNERDTKVYTNERGCGACNENMAEEEDSYDTVLQVNAEAFKKYVANELSMRVFDSCLLDGDDNLNDDYDFIESSGQLYMAKISPYKHRCDIYPENTSEEQVCANCKNPNPFGDLYCRDCYDFIDKGMEEMRMR